MRKFLIVALLFGGLTLSACRYQQPAPTGGTPSGASAPGSAPAPSGAGKSCGGSGKS